MCGIGDIPHTGIIFGDSILIIADTKLVTTMTRIFITSIIVARGEVGIKDYMAFVPLGPPVLELPVLDITLGLPVLDFIPLGLPVLDTILGLPVLDIILPGVLVLDIILPGVLVLAVVALDPPVLHIVLKPPLPAVVNLGKLLLMRKNIRSSSPTGASSQIALGRAIWDHFESEIKVSLV
jgi:hypothetical protein